MRKQDHITRKRLKKVHALMKSGRMEDARIICGKICARKGASTEAWRTLGHINYLSSRIDDAVANYQQAVDMSPDDADLHCELANALLQQGHPISAAKHYKTATKLEPNAPKLLTNYAAVLMGLQRYSEAEPVLRAAIRSEPLLSKPYINLGGCLTAQGKVDEAIACLEEGLERAGPDPVLHSSYLLSRHYQPLTDARENLSAHRHWATRNLVKENKYRYHDQIALDSGRKLRIGYVSPDFRTHSVAYFLRPLLANHNRPEFQIFCYSDVKQPDVLTQQFRSLADTWRDTSRLGDEELVRCISMDRIDILVDLAGHTGGNRLMVFARKPAPIQVTWLGYPDTTGLTTMDYRITDQYADPADSDSGYTETLHRLAGCFLCYESIQSAPDVKQAPVSEGGVITFGSFNNLAKINREVIRLWARLLKRVADSRLMLKNPGLTDAVTRERYLSKFREAGIDTSRITLKGVSRTTQEHLAEYHNIDIALDTFPYNGTTTTCEALWMGVPVQTLAGSCHAGRVSGSLLAALDMREWIAQNEEEYVDSAVTFAANPEALMHLRGVLRCRMAKSLLCDGRAFASRIEDAFHIFWRRWCKQYQVIAAGPADSDSRR